MTDFERKERTMRLYEKIKELEGDYATNGQCLTMAIKIMRYLPTELIPNIDEWIEGRDLSDIKVNGWSVADVMTQFGDKKIIPFLSAVECLGRWKVTGYKDKDFCRDYYAYDIVVANRPKFKFFRK